MLFYPTFSTFPVTRSSVIVFLMRATSCAMTMVWARTVSSFLLVSQTLVYGTLAEFIRVQGLSPSAVLTNSLPSFAPMVISAAMAFVSFYAAVAVCLTEEEVPLWWRDQFCLPRLPAWLGGGGGNICPSLKHDLETGEDSA
ncbi:hypothetical protein B0H19DRAFT_1150837 [Mycena capillaripes]|nr:hypothetical protein B0H19DRAFT_1150837 [Mycena capillaripes]